MKNTSQSFTNFKRTVRNPRFLLAAGAVLIVVSTLTIVGVVHYNARQNANSGQYSQAETQSTLENIDSGQAGIADAQSSQSTAPANQSINNPATPGQNTNTSPSGNSSSPAPTAPPQQSSSQPSSTSPQNTDTPQVTLTYPSSWGQTVSGVITITANASDSNGIEKVVFMIRKIGQATPIYSFTDTGAPYSTSFDTRSLPNGGSNYTVEAQAFDTLGVGNLASYRINIQN